MVVFCTVLVTAILIFLVPTGPRIQFTFLGYERSVTGALIARFELRNMTASTAFMVGELPFQAFENGRWRWSQAPKVTGTGLMGIPGIWQVGLPCPTNNTHWRAAVVSHELSTYRFREKVSDFLASTFGKRLEEEAWGQISFSESIPPPIGNYPEYKPLPRSPEAPSPFE